tara:strand:+ start:75147 stop:75635 length:489 start_codon:yes stop_codon:yes gene_type:complete
MIDMSEEKPVLYIDMDDTACAFSAAKQHALGECPEQAYPHAAYGFYANLEPVRDAVETIKEIIAQGKFDVWFLTAPSVDNPLSYTEKIVWVLKHFGREMAKKTIICYDKSKLKGAVLIDDKCDSHGQDKFEGILLHFATVQCPDWQAVRTLLEKHYPTVSKV